MLPARLAGSAAQQQKSCGMVPQQAFKCCFFMLRSATDYDDYYRDIFDTIMFLKGLTHPDAAGAPVSRSHAA